MAGFALAARLDWWRGAVSGVAFVLGALTCNGFLSNVLAAGGTSPWAAIVAGMVFTGMVAYLIGGQVLRLKGHYLGMATLGFWIIIEIIFKQCTAITGGSSDGIFGIPTIKFVDGMPGPIKSIFCLISGGEPALRQQYYFLVWGLVFIALVLAVNIVKSRVGRAFRAVHGSEVAAESLGVDTERYKVQVFVLSAALASLAGSLHAHNAGIGYVNPAEFSFVVSVQLVAMVVIGGMASVWGALFGATAIWLLNDWMLEIGKADAHVMGLKLQGLDPIVFGAILIAVMILMPQGLVRGLTDLGVAAWRSGARARMKDG
jgi:branched-chain amino acid transport system permease protein